MCEWSSRALRSILAHAATAPLSARAGKPSKSVSGETDVKAHEKSTTTTCLRRRSECDSAARLLMSIMCVEAGRITYLLQYPFSISHPTIARHGRQPSPCTPLSVCLSVSLSGWLPFSCVPRLPSQLCVQCCPAASARTPVWHLPAELGVVAGSARKPAARLKQAPYLCSTLELSSTFGGVAPNSVSLAKRGANHAPSLASGLGTRNRA